MTGTESNKIDFGKVVEVAGQNTTAPFLLVCEHASNRIPDALNCLGLSRSARASHIAWDPGARELAVMLAEHLKAPLVAGCLSRLVYDCNRAPGAADAMPFQSEAFAVPGNFDLSDAQRTDRVRHVYHAFHDQLAHEIQTRRPQAIMTVHSFTPVYKGARRDVEIGILHGRDAGLAKVMLETALADTRWDTRLNAPYGPDDGVAHTLDRHGAANAIPSVMIEVRNDLLEDPGQQQAIADHLSRWFLAAIHAEASA